MDFDALKDLQPADYQSSSSDDSSDEELQKSKYGQNLTADKFIIFGGYLLKPFFFYCQ
jgi:hypothetical protein